MNFPFSQRNEEKVIINAEERQKKATQQNIAFEQAMKTDEIDVNATQKSFEIISYIQGVEYEIMSNLEHELKNHHRNYETNTWEIEYVFVGYDESGNEIKKPLPWLLNEQGITEVLRLTRPFVNRNMFNSNFDEKKVNQIMKSSANALSLSLHANYNKLGLGRVPNLPIITSILRSYKLAIIAGPYRALNDGERRNMRSFTKKIETSMDNSSNSDRRGWSFLGG